MRTNDACELGFSLQKQRVYRRVAKKQVAYMVSTRGEAYLRVTHCSPEELEADILASAMNSLIKRLGLALQARIEAQTREWHWSDTEMGGYIGPLFKFYPGWEDIKAEGMLG